MKKSQPAFPLVRGRCGPRFALPSGAPAKCDAEWVTWAGHDIVTRWSLSGWPLAAPPEAGAPAPPRTASVMTASITSGRRVSALWNEVNSSSELFSIFSSKVTTWTIATWGRQQWFYTTGLSKFLDRAYGNLHIYVWIHYSYLNTILFLDPV